MEIEATHAGLAGARRVGRRGLLAAGLGGASASLLPVLLGRAAATTPDDSTPDENTTTTAPPKRPSEADVALLGAAQQVELTMVALYDDAIAGVTGWSDEDAVVMVAFREAHEDSAVAISALLGRQAPNARSESLYSALAPSFVGGRDDVVATAWEAESAAVATHGELLGSLQGFNGATLIAAIQMAEARHCTVLADLLGTDDPALLLVDDEADPLEVNG